MSQQIQAVVVQNVPPGGCKMWPRDGKWTQTMEVAVEHYAHPPSMSHHPS